MERIILDRKIIVKEDIDLVFALRGGRGVELARELLQPSAINTTLLVVSTRLLTFTTTISLAKTADSPSMRLRSC